jgi:hypothetical protein
MRSSTKYSIYFATFNNPGPSPGAEGFLQNQGAWINQGGQVKYNVSLMHHVQVNQAISSAKLDGQWVQNINPQSIIASILAAKNWFKAFQTYKINSYELILYYF